MFFYEDPSYEDNCFECNEKQKELDDAKYWLKYILEQLYSTEFLDIDEFERSIEELCSIVGLKIPLSALQIQRKESPKNSYHPCVKQFDIQGWVKWNNQYLKKLNQKEVIS